MTRHRPILAACFTAAALAVTDAGYCTGAEL